MSVARRAGSGHCGSRLSYPSRSLPPAGGQPQFSVGDVLIVMVGVAVGLAGGTWMPTDHFAAVMGLVTLLGLLVVICIRPKRTWAS